ncbi:hypothetical protein WJ048_13740 [Listeria welshimeri]|uniref:Putative membrane protein n=1 Tax=Listeria welshimeri serovar 6b (strain ATCC 35897 / DSM 20650 / CCUG 15529 / CIP 8149 / NCTC 11857 / SLCC 5334 / V8) TaxID=386043 RepID=A0AM62_LISW6|nr:hypothetical protein [Listeria welshimeri]CAK22094.1 putative membrane protein [Listeria welshimeri serovar 6b str. SLCC5334]SNV32710.1 Uncharacterised protein [Listeria welshimeri]
MKFIMSKITFEEAKQLIDIRDKENTTSQSIKLFIRAFFCGFMALLPLKNSIVITSILIIIIVISFLYYYISKANNKLLEEFSYQLAKYVMLQTTTVSILLGIRVDGETPFGEYYVLVALCYLFLVAVLGYFRCRAMILNYLKNNGINLKGISVSKIWNKVFLKLSIILLVIIGLGTQLYRLNKWWFIGNNSSSNGISIQNEWLGMFLVLVVGILLIILLVVFSLLPTLLFNAKTITEGILLKEYATEFQQENTRSNQ